MNEEFLLVTRKIELQSGVCNTNNPVRSKNVVF